MKSVCSFSSIDLRLTHVSIFSGYGHGDGSNMIRESKIRFILFSCICKMKCTGKRIIDIMFANFLLLFTFSMS